MSTLIDEIVARVRGTLAGEFGDDGTDAGCKIWGDLVPPEALPWAVLYETGESYTFMSRGPAGVSYLADGQITLEVFAADRQEAKDLGVAVAFVLDDSEPVLQPSEGHATMIRVVSAAFVPMPEVAPDSPTTYRRTLTIQYQQQRTIGNG